MLIHVGVATSSMVSSELLLKMPPKEKSIKIWDKSQKNVVVYEWIIFQIGITIICNRQL